MWSGALLEMLSVDSWWVSLRLKSGCGSGSSSSINIFKDTWLIPLFSWGAKISLLFINYIVLFKLTLIYTTQHLSLSILLKVLMECILLFHVQHHHKIIILYWFSPRFSCLNGLSLLRNRLSPGSHLSYDRFCLLGWFLSYLSFTHNNFNYYI